MQKFPLPLEVKRELPRRGVVLHELASIDLKSSQKSARRLLNGRDYMPERPKYAALYGLKQSDGVVEEDGTFNCQNKWH